MHPWDLIWGIELRNFDMLKRGKAKGQVGSCKP